MKTEQRLQELLSLFQKNVAENERLLNQFQELIDGVLRWTPTNEAAQEIDVPEYTLREWVREGRLEYGRHYISKGRGYAFNLIALAEWMKTDPAMLRDNLEVS